MTIRKGIRVYCLHKFISPNSITASGFRLVLYLIKVVICGKYINLNKITKILRISLKFNRLLIFVFFLQFTMQNTGIFCLKKCFTKERSKGIFVRENLKK